jgi:hypothetical protein
MRAIIIELLLVAAAAFAAGYATGAWRFRCEPELWPAAVLVDRVDAQRVRAERLARSLEFWEQTRERGERHVRRAAVQGTGLPLERSVARGEGGDHGAH